MCIRDRAGATIVFNDIKQELVDKGIASYKEEGIEAHGYVCDVTDEAAVQLRDEALKLGLNFSDSRKDKEETQAIKSVSYTHLDITLYRIAEALSIRFVDASWRSGDSDMSCLIASGKMCIRDRQWHVGDFQPFGSQSCYGG